MNTLTMVVFAYLAVCMARGFFRGFLRTFFSMVSVVLVIVTGFVISPYVNHVVGESMHVREYCEEKSGDLIDAILAGEYAGDSPFGSALFGDEPGESENGTAGALGAAAGYAAEALGLRDIITEKVINTVVGVISMAATYLIASLFWFLAQLWMTRRLRGRGARLFDRVLGMPLGLLRGFLVVWIVFGFISVASFTEAGGALLDQIRESPYLSAIYSLNPLESGLWTLLKELV